MLSLIVCPEAKLFPLRCLKQRIHLHHHRASDLSPVFCQKHHSCLCSAQEEVSDHSLPRQPWQRVMCCPETEAVSLQLRAAVKLLI